jgi:hypothetical protein
MNLSLVRIDEAVGCRLLQGWCKISPKRREKSTEHSFATTNIRGYKVIQPRKKFLSVLKMCLEFFRFFQVILDAFPERTIMHDRGIKAKKITIFPRQRAERRS